MRNMIFLTSIIVLSSCTPVKTLYLHTDASNSIYRFELDKQSKTDTVFLVRDSGEKQSLNPPNITLPKFLRINLYEHFLEIRNFWTDIIVRFNYETETWYYGKFDDMDMHENSPYVEDGRF